MAKLSNVRITRKRSDTETVMLRLEGGGWKSANNSNSLATYPTTSTVLESSGSREGVTDFNGFMPRNFGEEANWKIGSNYYITQLSLRG